MSAFPSVIDLADFDPEYGFVIGFPAAAGTLSPSDAGDMNGDGFDDVLVGRSALGGEAYVVYGKASGFGTVDLNALTASQGFIIRGGDDFFSAGRSVSSAGDVNGDGHDDIIVGVYGGDGNAFVIFGKDGGFGTINLSALAPQVGFRIAGSPDRLLGNALSAAGDLNGDGFDDLVANAAGYGSANA